MSSINKGVNTSEQIYVTAYDWFDKVELTIPGLSGSIQLTAKQANKLSKVLAKAAKTAKAAENG